MQTDYATAELTQLTGSSKMNKLGESPIILRVYNPLIKKAHDYRTGYYCSLQDFESQKHQFASLLSRAEDVINKLRLNNQAFSFAAFERSLLSKSGSVSLVEYLQAMVDAESKEANKTAIKDLVSILRRVYPNRDFHFGEISYSWVLQFANKMRALPPVAKKSRGLTENGVRFHLRTLRKYYNLAKREGLAPRLIDDESPFKGINTQSVPSDEVKRYLNEKELNQFFNCKYGSIKKDCKWMEARDIWMFSYFGFGLNLKDILKLRWSDIKDGAIVLRREKTSRPLTIRIGKELDKILAKYKSNNTYIFEHLLTTGDKNKQETNHNNILSWVNTNIRKVAKAAGIDNSNQVTFYSARHTFAVHYMQKAKNPSVFTLMLYLGHSKEESTQNYLRSLIGNSEVKVVDFLDTIIIPEQIFVKKA